MENETFMRFPNGLEKALTFSYDDGVAADKRLMELFDKNGLKATFNLNSGVFGNNAHGRMNQTDTLKLFQNCHHEIASHGHKHLYLTRVNTLRGINEVLTDKKCLEEMFGRIVEGFAYAYGAFDENVKNYLAQTGIIYARTTVSTHTFDIPTDWLELNPTCHHADEGLMALADKFLQTYPHESVKFRAPFLFYVWGHSYEFDENNNWHIIENFVQKVSGKPDVWYATNVQVVRYEKAFRSLVFSAEGDRVFNPSCLDVWLEQRGKTYCVPSGKTVLLN